MTEKVFWHSQIEIKAVTNDGDALSFEGWATTPQVDRVGDTIDPMGAVFAPEIPLLHQHDHERPVGRVKFDKPTPKGIRFRARIPNVKEPGPLKDRIDTVVGESKYGLIDYVSIGFRPLEPPVRNKHGGVDYPKTEIYEMSLVTVAANPGARVDRVSKSVISLHEQFDIAASGNIVEPTSLRVRSKKSVNLAPMKGSKPMAKTIAEQIAALEATKQTKSARMSEIMQKAGDEGRSTDAEEQTEFDELAGDVTALDGDIKRLGMLQTTKAVSATPITAPNGGAINNAADGTAARSSVIIKAAAPAPGIRFARYARCLALSRKTGQSLLELIEQNYGTRDPDLVGIIKANVIAVNTTTDAALIGNEGGFADFVEYLRPMTIVGRFGNNGIPGLRRVPFRVPLIKQTGGAVGYWVGEGKPKPLTKPAWGRTELAPLKAANIAVATMEALRDSSPSAETLLRDDLAAAIVAVIDTAFVDPANAGSAGVKPASITDGLTGIASSGNDAASIRADVQAAMQVFIAGNNPITAGVWIMSATRALALSMMRTALDQPEFAGITMTGGTFFGLPVIVSEYVTDYVVLANASDIWFADDGGVSVDMSTEASLQMLDNPTNDSVTPTATTLVSMFQTNSVAFRAERTINWTRRRDTGVALIEDVAWGEAAS